MLRSFSCFLVPRRANYSLRIESSKEEGTLFQSEALIWFLGPSNTPLVLAGLQGQDTQPYAGWEAAAPLQGEGREKRSGEASFPRSKSTTEGEEKKAGEKGRRRAGRGSGCGFGAEQKVEEQGREGKGASSSGAKVGSGTVATKGKGTSRSRRSRVSGRKGDAPRRRSYPANTR